jgi:hypothetical protein
VEGLGGWRYGGEVFEPDSCAGRDVCYACVLWERVRYGGVEKVANASVKALVVVVGCMLPRGLWRLTSSRRHVV